MIQRFIIFTVLVLAVATLLPTPGLAANDSAEVVLVFGGTGRTGVEIVRALREEGTNVSVFVRPTSNREPLSQLGVNFVVGDAFRRRINCRTCD